MELQFFGGNCVRITTKKASVIIDDNLSKLGLKPVTKPTDIAIHTHTNIPRADTQFTADMPGEYEVADVVIHGVGARALKDDKDRMSATIYTVESGDLKVAVIGHIFPELSESQLEQMGQVDIAIVPVGGNNYTLDGTGALAVIKKLEPRVIIPTHYADKGIKYEVSQIELSDALKGLAMEPHETTDKYKPKESELTDTAQLIVLKRQ